MRYVWVILLALALAACAPRLPEPCPEGPRDGGVGGTGHCQNTQAQ